MDSLFRIDIMCDLYGQPFAPFSSSSPANGVVLFLHVFDFWRPRIVTVASFCNDIVFSVDLYLIKMGGCYRYPTIAAVPVYNYPEPDSNTGIVCLNKD